MTSEEENNPSHLLIFMELRALCDVLYLAYYNHRTFCFTVGSVPIQQHFSTIHIMCSIKEAKFYQVALN